MPETSYILETDHLDNFEFGKHASKDDKADRRDHQSDPRGKKISVLKSAVFKAHLLSLAFMFICFFCPVVTLQPGFDHVHIFWVEVWSPLSKWLLSGLTLCVLWRIFRF